MSDFERALPPCRIVETHWNDDLQSVAERELGDANRWPELVWINALVHPYIVRDERLVRPGVLLAGSIIKVPAPRGLSTDDGARGQVYERDCAMVDRKLQATETGDLAVVSGADNLRQQLVHRVVTPRGQARRHPTYGNMTPRLLGKVNVEKVEFSRAEVVGDVIRITARAIAVDGGVVDLNRTITE